MPKITADFTHEFPDLSPVIGTLEISTTTTSINGMTVTVPAKQKIDFEDGPFTFDLEPTPETGEWYYTLKTTLSGVGIMTENVLVPNLDTLDYGDLEPVETNGCDCGKTHALPSREPNPEWWAALNAGLKSARPGPQGERGPAGIGTPGPEGPEGQRGIQGRQGPQGKTGENGSNVIPVQDAVASYMKNPESPVNAELVKYGNKLLGGFQVSEFGAVGDSIADDTEAIQNAINAAAARVISSKVKDSGVVYMGGKYKISKTIVQPPYVKIVTRGATIIESYVENGSAWWITPQESDPTNLYPGTLGKEQWMRGSLIDGSSGGVIIINKRATPAGTIGLELGSRDNMHLLRQLGRYTLNDIAVQGFDIGQQINTNNHYLGIYTRMHLETNTTDIRIGTGALNNASGENFNWVESIIAGSMTGVDFNSDGVNCTFTNCSFDFLGTVFKFQKGWMRVVVENGHIEVINEASRKTANGGIAVSTVTSGIVPDLIIRGAVPYVTKERGVQFRGNMRLWAEIQYRSSDITNFATEDSWLCDDSVQVRAMEVIQYSAMARTSKSLGMLKDPVFANEPAGTIAKDLANYTVKNSGNATAVISDDGPRPGAKSLEVTVSANNGYQYMASKDLMPCRPGERLHFAPSYKLETLAGNPQMSSGFEFFDSNKVSLGAATNKALTRVVDTLNQWCTFGAPINITVPPGAAYFQALFTVSITNGQGSPQKISDIHVYRN